MWASTPTIGPTKAELHALNVNNEPRYCKDDVADTDGRLAVLGVLSTEEKGLPLRTMSRTTWLGNAVLPVHGLLVRFVLRGLGAGAAVREEAVRYRDIAFVRAASNTSYKVAPLRSALLWFECAMSAWPRAKLVGKADDDTYLRPRAVVEHLLATLAASRRGGNESLLYWGQMESFNWDIETHRPAMPFEYGHRALLHPRSCKRFGAVPAAQQPTGHYWRNALHLFWNAPTRRADIAAGTMRHVPANVTWHEDEVARSAGLVVGPFLFAKGPLFFLSRQLLPALLSSTALRRDAAETIRSGLNTSYKEPSLPWEDIYLGFALSQISQRLPASTRLAAVHVRDELAFMESYSHSRGPFLAMARR